MTPTEQNKKLREKLDELLKSPRYGISLFAGHRDILVEILADLITADRKRVALEARLDERQMLNFHRAYGKDYQATLETLEEANDKRIAELKAQQEEA